MAGIKKIAASAMRNGHGFCSGGLSVQIISIRLVRENLFLRLRMWLENIMKLVDNIGWVTLRTWAATRGNELSASSRPEAGRSPGVRPRVRDARHHCTAYLHVARAMV
jgi:hypothetical protein